MKAELIIPVGIAIMAIPIRLIRLLSRRPIGVMGYISPYPTVVKATMAHQNPSPIFSNACGYALRSM